MLKEVRFERKWEGGCIMRGLGVRASERSQDSGRERVLIRGLRGSHFRQQRVVCFTGAPLVRRDAV